MKYYYRSELAKIAGINIETLRYYENEQLIPIPKRNPNMNVHCAKLLKMKRKIILILDIVVIYRAYNLVKIIWRGVVMNIYYFSGTGNSLAVAKN